MIFSIKDSKVLECPSLLSYIFSFLQLHNLSVAAQVSSFWYAAAKREFYTRERKALQECLFILENLPEMCKFLANKYHATVLFYNENDNNGKNDFKNPVYSIEKQHIDAENIIIKIPVHTVMRNNFKVDSFSLEAIRGLMSLHIPIHQKIQFYSKSNIVEFLGLQKDKATFLLFGEFDLSFLNEIKLRCKKKEGNSTLWGGFFYHPMTLNGVCRKRIGIKLPAEMESWSVTLSYKLNKEEFQKKLMCLRDKIKFKKYTIGLVCGQILFSKPSNKRYTTEKEVMKAIKQIFLKIPIIGMFSRNASTYFYGVDSITKDPVRQIIHTKTLSLIILS